MSDHALKYILRVISGKEVKFGKITARDRAKILATRKAIRKSELRTNLKEAGLSPEQAFAELEAFDDQPWGEPRFIEFANLPEGREEIVRLALSKYADNPLTADEVVEAVETEDGGLGLVMCAVANLEMKPMEQPAPNPTTPPTETAIPTTGATYGT